MTHDTYDLDRFVLAQAAVYADVCGELRRGRKTSHWIWFIFPQIEGLGSSPMAQRFAIRTLEEARAYLAHPLLGVRLEECCRLLLEIEGRTATEVMGTPDDLKLRSSMTLFERAAAAPGVFAEVLEKFYLGLRDERTLRRL